MDTALVLGAAVVKVACKIWLRDDAFAADASSEVVDIVRARVAGDLDRRRASRMFEDLEVPIAEKLRVLRQHELAGMPDNEWNAAVLAVGDTLRRARFTDADIFAGDLDPLYLRRSIAEGNPTAARDLSEAGTALYYRLLTECCSYVVELTSTLPRFSLGAFGEILRRQSVILRRFTELLDRMPSAEQERIDATDADTAFTAAYRRQVVSQLDRLELFGITLSESIRGYPLSTAYISLSVYSESLSKNRSDLASPVGSNRELSTSTLRIEDALARSARLFLRGEAGSGKTTMLQWLAVRAARRDFPSRLTTWNETVPFLIRLRHYIGKRLEAPEGFLGQVGQHIADEMPRGWVHRLLKEGRGLILIDGLDELPEAERNQVRDWLSGLVNAYPDSRYVVTSRPAAASERWLYREGFDVAQVQPMSWPNVRQFVRHWHDAFRDDATDEDRRSHLSSCESSLLDALYAKRHLRVLAANPLLCALICALHLDRRMHLPRDRMELYAVALDMLLERRDSARQIPSIGAPLSKTETTQLLEDLAFWLIRNGWSDVPKERAVERLILSLHSMPKVQMNGAMALDHLLLRSGLLREPVVGRVDFVHRTFEEYLAAHAAVTDDQIGELIRNAHDDQWREVVVLATGHAQPRQRDELLLGLLARSAKETQNQQALQLLAVACLESSPQLNPELNAKIERVAEDILPPSSISQAETLARIGEPLLDLLGGRKARSAGQAIATIRAASLIGSDAALRVVASAALLPGNAVRDEVMRAWLLFDTEEYARTVVSGSPHAKDLRINDRALIPALRHLSQLSWLTIEDIDDYKDLIVIRELPQLTGLCIANISNPGDLDFLTQHPGLERVVLSRCNNVDLRPLATVPHLRAVSFRADNAIGIQALRDCAYLEELEIASLPPERHLLDYLPAQPLHGFGLEGYLPDDLSPLIGISQLSALKHLSLTFCENLSSVSGIECFAASLQSLVLGGHGPAIDLSSLPNLDQLDTLELSWYPRPDLTIVRHIPALRHLYLDDKWSCDLSPLRGITGLTVHVSNTQRVNGAELLGDGSRVVVNNNP